MTFGTITQADCLNVAPVPDPRCQDAAFRLANPSLCPMEPILVIKPAVALVCPLGSVQFRAFLVVNGAETDVTSQSTFSTGNPNVALVGAASGNATGLMQGETQISAAYLDKSASGELTVLGSACCTDRHVALMALIDNSRSMSLTFSAPEGSRLKFAKAAAQQFISEINSSKDSIGLESFNAAETNVLSTVTSDKNSVAALVPPIIQTQQQTSFYDALAQAIGQLESVSADERVIVLFSDGEDTTPNYTDANNPIALVEDFKSAGGIVICFGVRASDKGYNFLSVLATGGFFVNALPSNAQEAQGWLSGLKGYICAGNCTPEGDIVQPTGKLLVSDLTDWNVTGFVDLLGNGLFDYFPGNGLYLQFGEEYDGHGTRASGRIDTKATIPLTDGHQYRITLWAAGDPTSPGQTASLQWVLVNEATSHVDQAQTISWPSPPSPGFAPYSFSFTQSGDVDARLRINNPSGVPLLLKVQIDDITDMVNAYRYYDFQNENPLYVPPRCGPGSLYAFLPDEGFYGYGYGYNCDGYGCLEEPPPVQVSDPNPLQDIESGFQPPRIYHSTRTACASCGTGTVNTPTTELTPVSEVVLAGVYTAEFDKATKVGGYALSADNAGLADAWIVEGSNEGSTWTTLDSHQPLQFYAGERKLFPIPVPASFLFFRLTPYQAPFSVIKLYSVPPSQICSSATAESEISQADADNQATAQALAAGQAQLRCAVEYKSTQQYTAQCPFGSFGQDVTKSASSTSLNAQADADSEALATAKALAEADLSCDLSNNDQMIVINDRGSMSGPAPATPYPSVAHLSGITGLLVTIKVTILNFKHDDPGDVHCLLRSPSGTLVELFRNAGNGFACSGVDLVFRNDGGPYGQLPQNGAFTSGTFDPSQYDVCLDYPGPVPICPYSGDLNDFLGEDPNGSWALLFCDDTSPDAGSVDSWTLEITAA